MKIFFKAFPKGSNYSCPVCKNNIWQPSQTHQFAFSHLGSHQSVRYEIRRLKGGEKAAGTTIWQLRKAGREPVLWAETTPALTLSQPACPYWKHLPG